jgi:hypothetical protein
MEHGLCTEGTSARKITATGVDQAGSARCFMEHEFVRTESAVSLVQGVNGTRFFKT